MPLSKVNYANTIIYRIFSDNCDYVYIGSTTNFVARKANHKSNCNNETTCSYNLKVYKTIRANGGWDAFKMLEVEEYPCENSKQARKREQYWIDFYKSNLNINKAFTGETIEEARKQRYEENKKENLQKQKEYYIENSNERIQYAKQYRVEYAQQISDKKKEKFTCQCGVISRISDKIKHYKTKKHLEAV